VCDKEQLDELVRDLKTLKSSIKKNRTVIYEMMIGKQLGILALVMGIALTGFALTAHFLTLAFGSWSAIPASIRIVMAAVIALLAASGALFKFIGMSGRAKEMGSVSSLKEFIIIYYSSGTLLHNTIAACLIIVAGSVLAVLSGHPWLILPLISAAIVFPVNDIATASGLKEYNILGYWCLAAGVSSFLYVERLPFIALAISGGGMFIAFAVLAFASIRGKEA
jgi:hypothetical protein